MNKYIKPLMFVAGIAVGIILAQTKNAEEKNETVKEEKKQMVDEEGVPVFDTDGNPIYEETTTEESDGSSPVLNNIRDKFSTETITDKVSDLIVWGINHKDELELAGIVMGVAGSAIGLKNSIADSKTKEIAGKLNWFEYIKKSNAHKMMLASDMDPGVFVIEYVEGV